MSNINQKLNRLQELVIEQLIAELESGNTENIGTANTLLTANKIVVARDEGSTQHSKVKKIIQRNKQ